MASIFTVNRRDDAQEHKPLMPTIRMAVNPRLRYISSRELLRRCVNRDSPAWYELIRRYGGAIYAAIIMELESGIPSEDGTDAERILGLVVDTLLEHDCASLRKLDDPETIRAYLCQTARAVTLDYVEQKSAASSTTNPYESFRASAPWTDSGTIKDECRRLARALESLSARHQFFLRLYYEQGLACSEIAELTRTPSLTVAAIVDRARNIASKLVKRRWRTLVRKTTA